MSNSNKTRNRHITASDYNFLQISLPCFKIQLQVDLEFGAIANTKNILFRLGFCKSSPADIFMVSTTQL